MNDYIKRSMGILAAICLAAFIPACSGSKTLSSSSEKKPTVSVASSRPCSSCCSSSPVSSAVTSAASSIGDSSKSSATTQHTGGKSAGTTGKSTGRTTGGGGTGGSTKTGGGTGGSTHTGGGTGGGTTGGGTTGGGGTDTPAPAGFSTQYYGANYGCEDASQYSYVLSKARNIENTAAYHDSYSTWQANQDLFQQETGVPYSDEWNEIVSLQSACGSGSKAIAGSGSAYAYFTGSNTACGDRAKALEASLNTHGYNAKLCWSSTHMWVMVCVHGTWYHLTSTIGTSPSGYSEAGCGYNYG